MATDGSCLLLSKPGTARFGPCGEGSDAHTFRVDGPRKLYSEAHNRLLWLGPNHKDDGQVCADKGCIRCVTRQENGRVKIGLCARGVFEPLELRPPSLLTRLRRDGLSAFLV